MTTKREMQYSERVDAVVYGCDTTAQFTPEDWAQLAVAALDQAGVTLASLKHGAKNARSWSDLVEFLTVTEAA